MKIEYSISIRYSYISNDKVLLNNNIMPANILLKYTVSRPRYIYLFKSN